MDNDNRPRHDGGLTYPCGPRPAFGEMREVAPGVQWTRMPLPPSLAAINLWLLDDDSGYTLVDTGINSPEARQTWEQLFDGALHGRALQRVLVTHLHPDHVGLAGWLCARFDCRLWMTRLEYMQCRVLAGDTGREAPPEGLAFYRRAGWDEDALAMYRSRFGNFGRMIWQLPDSFRRIRDGESVRIGNHHWEVVVGAGHTPEHACLYDPARRLLITGDQVLPRISSNLSVHPIEPDADPIGDWLVSLVVLRQRIADDVLVLPAHGEPFHGLHARLDQLRDSLLATLQRLRQGLQRPRRAIDTFELLFSRPIPMTDGSLMSLATGESLAHLNHLLHRGELEVETDSDGVAWYRLRSEAATEETSA
ncbi:MBL fold metallo-hydrolase [Pseudomonas sp. PSE14]|uniref:MBL fold metallo-hydrolase n=1 Tax=Pseudomonas sp. PSE14 TaxID=3016341 RepID=UPI0023D8B25D|nr:MBL fold metallo-hydrolase [Pseudomonas sp. PSE14]WEJ74735.1 MBL fold metallo-hydrolase [Pseudomonas sp. PSE14]